MNLLDQVSINVSSLTIEQTLLNNIRAKYFSYLKKHRGKSGQNENQNEQITKKSQKDSKKTMSYFKLQLIELYSNVKTLVFDTALEHVCRGR